MARTGRNKSYVKAKGNKMGAVGAKTVGSAKSGKRASKWFAKMPKLPLMIMLLIVTWGYLYFLYGDMMLVAEQRSFFAFDKIAMQFYLCQPLGWLYATGRFMLLICRWPIVGTLLIAVMLTVSAWLLDEVLKLKGYWHIAALCIPFLYFCFLFYRGLNLVYLREISFIMTIPLMVMIILALAALVMRILTKRSLNAPWRQQEVRNARQAWGLYAALVVMLCGSVAVAKTYAYNDRITCGMERLMYSQDWDGMASLAKTAPHPSRTVAAYHALALNQNGTLTTELFNFPYQYCNAHITKRNGDFDGGMDYFAVDCNFSAGLTRSAYHEAMEQMVHEGPSVRGLKRMIQCCVIDREDALARKYLAILSKVPFESEFVDKYNLMLQDYNNVLQDSELASVIELQPVHDSFEQIYREPMFLGYNLCLKEAKSVRGLHNSLLACLYTKDMKAFGLRILTLIENRMVLPKIYEEAVVVQNLKNLSVLKELKISPYTLQAMKNFMGESFANGKNEMPKDKARKFGKYLGTYQYYYFFQNIPDENYVIPEKDGKKGGVN